MNNRWGRFIEWNKRVWCEFCNKPMFYTVIGLLNLSIWAAIGWGTYGVFSGKYLLAVGCGAYLGGFIAFCRAMVKIRQRKLSEEIETNLKNGRYTMTSL